MKTAPIALFVYNRPWHTQQTVEALQKNHLAAESDLFIFADGPKKPEHVAAVEDVRKYIRGINGFASVSIIEREENLGLAGSIIRGVTEVVNTYGRIIVLEDDLITSPHFLRYMNNALERYQDDEQVMQVSAYMYPIDLQARTDAVFMPFTTSWGWATWKRAWDEFDPFMRGYEALQNSRSLKRKFDLDGTYPCYAMLVSQKERKIDSWAIRWWLSVFMAGGIVLHPVQSLVRNVGFDNSGVHCSPMGVKFSTTLSDFKVTTFPERIELDLQSFRICRSFLKSSDATFINRVKGFLHEFIRSYQKTIRP